MIERSLYSPDHEAFRDSFRRFIDKEIAPFHADWEEQGYVDRAVWNKAGENGFLCMSMADAYGGSDANRRRLAIEIVESVREHWPAHKLVCKRGEFGLQPALAWEQRMLAAAAAAAPASLAATAALP